MALKDKIFTMEKAIIGAVITIASLIAIAFAVYFHFENKFVEINAASAAHGRLEAEIHLTGVRLDEKILEDRIARLEERIWRYEEKFGPNCGEHRQLCQQWRLEIARLERQLRGVRGR